MANRITSADAWWWLTKKQKQLLQQQRQAGRFGGANAAGIGRAPYVWSQESGNPAAKILPREFIKDITASLRQSLPDVVRMRLNRG